MITDIRLQHFRSYDDASFELGDGVNIIVGPNASGKTNLLEAILVAARGNSYRAKDAELVQFEQEWARIDAHTATGSRTVKIACPSQLACAKSFVIDDKPFSRLSMQKTLPIVLFEPTHLLLLGGAPELRRAFLDELLEQTRSTYSLTRKQYRRALSQRNALLKKGYATANQQLFAWNIRLSELGGQIAQARQELVTSFNKRATELYDSLSRTEAHIEFHYSTPLPITNYSTHLLRRLEASVERDCERGFTSSGPHREDLEVFIDGHAVQESGSRGEVRTLLLVLKILELQQLEEYREQKPLLLLDDVFSELDGARRQALTHYLKDYQTFITTTDADVVVQHFMSNCTIIPTTH